MSSTDCPRRPILFSGPTPKETGMRRSRRFGPRGPREMSGPQASDTAHNLSTEISKTKRLQQNRTLRYGKLFHSDYQSKASLFPNPKRFASNISTPFAVLPLAHSCAAAAPGSVLRTNTAPDFFQLLQPIRPEPPHEPPKARILSCVYLFQFKFRSVRSVFALTWSQWAAIMTAFPVPLA